MEPFAEVGGPEWDELAEHTVGEAMSRAVCSVPASADVYTAAESMLRASVHRLLVMDAGRLVGILRSMDIVRAVAEHRLVTASPEARATPRVWADVRR